MKFPAVGVAILKGLAARYPELAHGEDPQRRQLIKMAGENLVAVTGDRNWGNKARRGLGDENRGKDNIAYRESDSTTSVWDTQSGTTREYIVEAGSEPNYPHLSDDEARFIPLEPIDHLGMTGHVDPGNAQPSQPNQPPPAADFNRAVLSFIDDVRASLGRVEGVLGQPIQLPAESNLDGYVIEIPAQTATLNIRYLGTTTVNIPATTAVLKRKE